MATSLTNAIETVIKDNPLPTETLPVEVQPEAKTNEPPETTEETEETTEEVAETPGLTDLEKAQAVQLFNALKDPKTAGQVVDIMARQAGYTRAELAKAAPEEVKQDLQSLLEEHLGPELKFLSDKLAPVLEKAVDAKVDAKTKDIRATLATQEEERTKNSVAQAINGISEKLYGNKEIPKEVITKMNQLMDETKPTPEMTIERYITKIHNEACGELGISVKKPVSNQDRINKNRTDAPSRLASERTGTATPVPDSKPMSLSKSVMAAVEAANAEFDKK